jgi:hypothetical protein
MLTWGEAFWKAFVTVLYTIGFAILGGLIIFAGAAWGIQSTYYGNFYNYWIIFPMIIIGGGIVVLGEVATIYRFVSKMIVENTHVSRVPDPKSGASLSDLDNLTKLKSLYDSGALTESEYNQQKKRFLG